MILVKCGIEKSEGQGQTKPVETIRAHILELCFQGLEALKWGGEPSKLLEEYWYLVVVAHYGYLKTCEITI